MSPVSVWQVPTILLNELSAISIPLPQKFVLSILAKLARVAYESFVIVMAFVPR